MSFTSRQLNILGGLLLAGYFVFCGFGCVLGMGMEAGVSSETTRPTLVTLIPLRHPTLTPTRVFPTATFTRVFPTVTSTRVYPTATPSPAVSKIDARLMCQEWIERQSVTGKVEFLWLSMQDYDLGDYHYKITGECESQNLYGATIRYRYSCELHADLANGVWVLDALFVK